MYLGVDLGTSSIKLLMADNSGKILGSQSESYELLLPQENYSEQNPDDWFCALVTALKKLGETYDLKQIKGVSFSGQMHGLVILDSDDKVIRPAILWNDNRTQKECDYLNYEVGKAKLIEWTGNIALTGFTAPKILWVKNNEQQNFNKIAKIMLPKDYLAYKMSGIFASDVSDSSGTVYFDVQNKCWSKPMLQILGISESMLPKVFESYQAVGSVSAEFAALTGMTTDTHVIIGGGDQAVGAIGTGTVDNNSLSISLGTSGVLFSASDNFAYEKEARVHSFCHANGKYHTMGVMLSAAGSLDWWVRDVLKASDFDGILAEVENTKINDLLFLPYLMGERSPINDPNAKGVFYGLNLMHSRANITRAILEGVSFGLYDCLLAMRELGNKTTSARVIGGGARSMVWLQILSDILGIELCTISSHDGGGLGAIILAMVGCGEYQNVPSACQSIIKTDKTFIPNKEKHKLYQSKFIKFKELYNKLK